MGLGLGTDRSRAERFRSNVLGRGAEGFSARPATRGGESAAGPVGERRVGVGSGGTERAVVER